MERRTRWISRCASSAAVWLVQRPFVAVGALLLGGPGHFAWPGPSFVSSPAQVREAGCSGGWLERSDARFDAAKLDARRWAVTSAHDFRQRSVEIVKRKVQPDRYWLRLQADTIGTDDRTVKFLGIRLREPLNLLVKSEVEVEIDWNQQPNGSYLTAGVFLAPAETEKAAELLSDWVKIEYVGVPPGKNGRAVVASKREGQLKFLHTEGWPDRSRAGRPIARQRLKITIDRGSLEVSENGQILYQSDEPVLSFQRAWLYLQMSSHSNYASRELFMSGIAVRHACSVDADRPAHKPTSYTTR